VEAALARELLDKLARTERGYTVVKYGAGVPHFKPGTHELVAP
jgi:CO dehydrogenase nickel-insertion accessory protein CooC1